uniref:NADH-ubiquinone oxidoreductase chain 4L n=1 Tax=Daphnia laevis TaxID=42853 RepID=A0A5Q0S279_9CRUS|nr:NADH dehydrogenase subunit 4L [Daphnia laevis]QGA47451.1 NADH dehydrogenase subunit 4L [Daphnia laevis]
MFLFLFGYSIIFLLSFISKRKHLLATLLSLEGLMLMLFALLYLYSFSLSSNGNFPLVFLTLTACEGALGLSLLVSLVRTHGGDQFSSLNSLQC